MKNPKREPIKVSDPNDKRLRAYNDSAQHYRYNPSDRVIELEKLNYDYKLEQKSGDWFYELNHKPVQPYVLEKKKTTPKPVVKTVVKATPKPVAKTVEKTAAKPTAKPKPVAKPVVKEDKKMYQGRSFMDSTGLRPGNYTPTQIKAAVAKKKLK